MQRNSDRRKGSAQGWASFKDDRRRARPYQSWVYDPVYGRSRHVGHSASAQQGRALSRAYVRVSQWHPAASVEALRDAARRLVADEASGQGQLLLGDGPAAAPASDDQARHEQAQPLQAAHGPRKRAVRASSAFARGRPRKKA